MPPGELFAVLWSRIERHTSEVILNPWLGRNAIEYVALGALLRTTAGVDVPIEIEDYLAGKTAPFATDVAKDHLEQRAFVVMCALDDAAMDIHPSVKTRIAGLSAALGPLQTAMKAARTADGRYGYVANVGSVIAKGQLTSRRVQNESDEANGANLDSQFEYLTVVADPTPHSVRFLVVPPYQFGMSDTMAQKLGIAPIAEDADDLTFTASSRSGRGYLDARPTNPDALGQRMAEAVAHLLDRGVGVVALPELVSSGSAIATLQKRLRSRPSSGHTPILVCGSGLSTDPCPSTGRFFNEATVLTGRGKVLFKQQKIHPFNMAPRRMEQCRVASDPLHPGKPHMEDIAAATVLTVCDLPDLGRIIVMICEDFEQAQPTGVLAFSTRPDWIFAPVLDVSLDLGRWGHQRCIEIGRRTLSRIVVTSSATLSVRREGKKELVETPADKVGIGILYDGHAGRRVKRLIPDLTSARPQTVYVDWDSSNWPQDDVGQRPA